jgi:hypothetical protein
VPIHKLVKDRIYGIMNLDLTEAKITTLSRLLSDTIDGDRFPLLPRIRMLKGCAILDPRPSRDQSLLRKFADRRSS